MKTQTLRISLTYLIICLYPTFKEWKHERHAGRSDISVRLYPTFKEWKLVSPCGTLFQKIRVYILPLRNENTYNNALHPLMIQLFISYL